VTVNLDFGPFQKKAEALCLSAGMRDLLLPFHRQIFCWIDEWIDMTKEDVTEYERACQAKVNELKFETSSKSTDVLADDKPVQMLKEEEEVLSPNVENKKNSKEKTPKK
jgi:hypothetical protein